MKDKQQYNAKPEEKDKLDFQKKNIKVRQT